MQLGELIRITEPCSVRLRVYKDGLVRGTVDYEAQRTELMLEKYGGADVMMLATTPDGLMVEIAVE